MVVGRYGSRSFTTTVSLVEIVIGAWRETFRAVRSGCVGDTAFTIVGIVHEEILSVFVDEISTFLGVTTCYISQVIRVRVTLFPLLQEKWNSISSRSRGANSWCRLVVDLVKVIVR